MDARQLALTLLGILYDAIKEAGETGIPSGHLYSMVMGKMSLDLYQQCISHLVTAGLITDTGHLLKYVNK